MLHFLSSPAHCARAETPQPFHRIIHSSQPATRKGDNAMFDTSHLASAEIADLILEN